MKPLKGESTNDSNTSWSSCHIDIWFLIARYLRPEDTMTFSLICKTTAAVTDSETFWSSMYKRYYLTKYPWLDRPAIAKGSSESSQVTAIQIGNLDFSLFQASAMKQFESFSGLTSRWLSGNVIPTVTMKSPTKPAPESCTDMTRNSTAVHTSS